MSDPSAITSGDTPSVSAAAAILAVQHNRPNNITTFDTSPSTSSSAPIQTSTTTTTPTTIPAPGPGTGKAKRSKHGCRTCRRRRKKCDETRPTCLGCRKLGIECEGYERPLIWGNGIASRGKLKGATVPTIEMWAPSKGRKGSEAGKKTSPEVRRGKVGEKSAGEEFGGPAQQVPGMDRRESTQSTYSEASMLQSQPASQQQQQQQQQPLPDFTIQEVKRIPFRPTASTMAAGMSTFAVAPAGAPAPAPQTSTPVQEPLATPMVEPASTPKSTSELTDKSSPNFEIVDIFSDSEEPLDQELYDRLILECKSLPAAVIQHHPAN